MIELSKKWSVKELQKDEVFWFEGEEASELAYIESGQIEIISSGRVVSTIEPGFFIGEEFIFSNEATRTATIQATQPTVIRFLLKEDISYLFKNDQTRYSLLIEKILMTLAKRAREIDHHFTRLSEGFEPRPVRTDKNTNTQLQAENDTGLDLQKCTSALKAFSYFEHISTEEIEALVNTLSFRRLNPGETLCVEGDPGNSIYFIISGGLRVVRNVCSQTSVTVAYLEKNMVSGILNLLLDEPRHTTFVAEQSTLILEMTREQYESLEGELAHKWREMLFESLRDHIISIGTNSNLLKASRAMRIQRDYECDNFSRTPEQVTRYSVKQLENINSKVEQIVQCLAKHRRLLPDSGSCAEAICPDCFAPHIDSIKQAVTKNMPVHFILPAFPAKSPNTKTKVIGTLPDMAEEQALKYLHRICEEVETIYAHGAKVTICADGRVFADLVLVSDEDIDAYVDELKVMTKEHNLNSIDIFNLEDLFEATDYSGMRDHVSIHYGEPVTLLRTNSKSDPAIQSMVNGIQRFLFEDSLELEKEKTASKIRKECRTRAYEVIQRSNGFSRLIAECFPNAVRLSIHPQSVHSSKMGVMLGKAEGQWVTPWHGVSLKKNGSFLLTKRSKAEELGAKLIMRNGRGYYYSLDDSESENMEPRNKSLNNTVSKSDTNKPDWESLYTYWFGDSIGKDFEYIQTRLPIWFFCDVNADKHINDNFFPWLNLITEDVTKEWKKTAKSFLTLILLFDQIPRNTFRGKPDSFKFDDYVRGLALDFIDKGFMNELTPIEAFWIYLPFQHDESIQSQQISVDGIASLSTCADSGLTKFFDICNDMAIRHQIAIEKFGRFPHRNNILNRESTSEELEFLKDPKNHF